MRKQLADAIDALGNLTVVVLGTITDACGRVFFNTAEAVRNTYVYVRDPVGEMQALEEQLRPMVPFARSERWDIVRLGVEPITIEPGEAHTVLQNIHQAFQPTHLALTGVGAGVEPGAAAYVLNGVSIQELRLGEHIIIEPKTAVPASVFGHDTQGTSFDWPAAQVGAELTITFKNHQPFQVTVLGVMYGRREVPPSVRFEGAP